MPLFWGWVLQRKKWVWGGVGTGKRPSNVQRHRIQVIVALHYTIGASKCEATDMVHYFAQHHLCPTHASAFSGSGKLVPEPSDSISVFALMVLKMGVKLQLMHKERKQYPPPL